MEQTYLIQGTRAGRLKIGYLETYDYALSQGNIPALYLCRLHNDSQDEWTDVAISVTSSDYIKPSQWHLDHLPAQSQIDSTLPLKIEPKHLMGLTEGVKAQVQLTVSIAGDKALEIDLSLNLMTYDHWMGISIHPDLLASFVTPNHPILSPVCVKASDFLEKWTGDGALCAYQHQDPNHVRKQVAAIYEALRSEGIVYCTPPAHFEQTGQRIRMVEQVLTEKIGTCLDLTLLFASCLEAIGLRPILVVTQGHIFVGAWLEAKYHISTIGDDPSYLIKGAADGIHEIVLVETTLLTHAGEVSFEDAVQSAMKQIYTEGNMQLFVDVYRARLSGIYALPLRYHIDGTDSQAQKGVHRPNSTEHIQQYDKIEVLSTAPKNLTKQVVWERKLLDLTLRNNLINIRLSKRVIPLVSFDIDYIEDQLQLGKQYTLHALPSHVKTAPDSTGIFHSAQYTQELGGFVSEEIEAGRLHSYLDEAELQSVLKHIYRSSRNALEENGANALFVAMGLVKWYETALSTKARYAPILLLPVDIVRKGGGYTIRLRDEDLMLNITLAELLKQEFGIKLTGLDPLPIDDSGVDVRKVLGIVRGHLRDRKRWDVLDEALLGLFSFNKFVMWNDIHNNADKLAQHPIIKGLINQDIGTNTLPDLPAIDAKTVDLSSSPKDFALPIDIDSSQMEAVLEAGQGRSFVLHGPPGTGKSQTITNMIANALYQGKRVLFVAEKMAALSVVQRRLAKIGLDPFCLELHSNKATKSHILNQLKETLEIGATRSTDEYTRIADELLSQRQSLRHYTDTLHSPQPSGLSLHDCISLYSSIKTDAIDVSPSLVDSMTPEKWREAKDLIRQADVILQIIGDPQQHPLKGLHIHTYDSQTSKHLASVISQWLQLWESLLHTEIKSTYDALRLPYSDSREDYLYLGQVAQALSANTTITPTLLRLPISEYKPLQELIETGLQKETLKSTLCQKYSSTLLAQDPHSLSSQWKAIQQKWFIPRFFSQRSFLNRLKKFAPSIDASQIERVIEDLKSYKSYEEIISHESSRLEKTFGSDLTPSAWTKMKEALHQAQHLRQCTEEYAQKRHLSVDSLLDTLSTVASSGRDVAISSSLSQISHTVTRILECERDFEALCTPTYPTTDLCTTLPRQASMWLSHLDQLKDRYRWCAYLDQLTSEGLGAVSHMLESGGSRAEAEDAFVKGFCHALATKVIEQEDQLRLFNGLLFEQTIEKYRSLTQQFMTLTKQELLARLSARVPRLTMEPAATSEVGILKRNIGNGGRGTSIRKLIEQIPNLLPKLCPCILMSPMSVAQYIDIEAEKFDLIIFDEASQMPTSEAIGAIARGKTLVVVGDPKQMPPTSFFASTQIDEEEADMDDMESILDDCIALSMPSRYLTWHYRSKHESLIAFSNNNYYDGRLLTFPSVDNRHAKVTHVPVQGTYDKGRTRSNKAEAEAIVQEVLRRLKDPKLSRYSIGIVSFSQVQQNLIEDLLLDALAAEPALEQIAFGGDEPIFIKNLENVQGDERDIILFSVGYGPDKDGRVSMNFGPLNNKGGERRLNVAVSRSRYEMLVFSTLRSEQIDLKRTQAKGVEGLKRFLEFAEIGRLSFIGTHTPTTHTDSLTQDVAHALRQLGHQVDLSVGSSQFKINLAIVDPEEPDKYKLGLLFDGLEYHKSKTIRDRDIVQPTVLQLLHWDIMRVWAVDWYEDRERVLSHIIKRLENPQPAAPPPPKPSSPPLISSAQVAPSTPLPEKSPKSTYTFADIPPKSKGGVDLLLSNPKQLSEQLKKLIQIEQPITASLVYKRIGAIWHITRMTTKVQSFIDDILLTFPLDALSDDQQRVHWSSASEARGYRGFRTDSQRDIIDTPLVEIKNAALAILSEQISLSHEALQRATAQLLGFSRMGGNIEAMTRLAISKLIQDDLAETKGDMIVYKEHQ